MNIIRFLHLYYHSKITGDILKTVQKPSASVLISLYDWWKWKWGRKLKIDHKDTTLIDLGLDLSTDILNIKCVSVQ